MKNVHITKQDGSGKNAPVIWEGDFELPTTVNEWITYLGSEVAVCDQLEGAEVIKIRAQNDPRRDHKFTTIEVGGEQIVLTKAQILAYAKQAIADKKSQTSV